MPFSRLRLRPANRQHPELNISPAHSAV